MILGVRFEIRGISYGGRLGPTLTVGPNIRLDIRVIHQFVDLCHKYKFYLIKKLFQK